MKSQTKFVLASLLVLTLLGLIFILFPTEQSTINFDSQCSLPNCPSGYSSVDTDCSTSSNKCYRYCEKTISGSCGSYSSYSRGKSFTYLSWDGSNNRGDSYYTDNYYTNDDYCYKFYSESKFTVSDWGSADSYRLFTMSPWNSESICSTSSSKTINSDSYTLGRGNNDGYRAIAEVTDYGGSSCEGGSPWNDLEGKLDLYLYVSKANWNSKSTVSTEVFCSYECDEKSDCGSDGYVDSKYCKNENVYQDYKTYSCSSYECDSSITSKLTNTCDYGCSEGSCIVGECDIGDWKCEGVDYYTCSENNWVDEGEVIGKCGVVCTENDIILNIDTYHICRSGVYVPVIDIIELNAEEQQALYDTINSLQLTAEENAEIINNLSSSIEGQILFINNLETIIQEKAQIIDNLNLNIQQQSEIISNLELTQSQQAEYIQELTDDIEEQAEMIEILSNNLEEKIFLINELTITTQEQADLINEMELSFAEQGEIINQLDNTISEDAEIIQNLNLNINDQAEVINNMKLTNEEQANLISELEITNDESLEMIKLLTDKTDEQVIIIANLKISNDEQINMIKQLTSNIQTQQELIDDLNEALLHKKQTQQNFVIIGIITLSLILFTISLIYLKKKKKKK
ncbi:MAG: hypothetical protein ACP6IY_09675 [Promethearchaeia archaeon]